MTTIAGREVTKNTMVGMSIGTFCTIIVIIWTAAGIGRPLFASDLERIEGKIDAYQTNTAIQILSIRKAALDSELRAAMRDLRKDPADDDAVEDVQEIEADIREIETSILCHRTVGCIVGIEI